MLGFLILASGCAEATLILEDRGDPATDIDHDTAAQRCEGYQLETVVYDGENVEDVYCYPTRPLTTVSGGDRLYDPTSGALTWTVTVEAAPEAPIVSLGIESSIIMWDSRNTGWTSDIPWERTTVSRSDGTVIACAEGKVISGYGSKTEQTVELHLDITHLDDNWNLLPITGIPAGGTVDITVAVELGPARPSMGDTITFETDGIDYWSAPPSVPEVATASEPLTATVYTFP